jgi:hypothetical protein
MREENYPVPVSDPEAEGLPEVADDDSHADDDGAEQVRIADGPSPAALPGDRDDRTPPVRFGTTAAEQRQGEPLANRLAQEEPDVPVDDPYAAPSPELADEAVDEAAAAQARLDADVFAEPAPAVAPRSQVSMYEEEQLDPARYGAVGRLVEPDEGMRSDEEPDATAYDAGTAGGGPSAEELAMHEVRPPD